MYLTAEQARKRATDSNNELRQLMKQIKDSADVGKVNICITGVSDTARNLLENLGYTVRYNIKAGTTLIKW